MKDLLSGGRVLKGRWDRALVRVTAVAMMLPLVFLLQSCGGGGGGGPGEGNGPGLGGGGGTLGGISPTGELGPTPITTQTGQILFSYTLFDTAPSIVSIRPAFAIVQRLAPLGVRGFKRVHLESVTFEPATPGLGGDGTTGLSASPAGSPHVFVWNSQKDLGTGQYEVQFEITPVGSVNGRATVSSTFVVDNPPVPAILSVTPSGQTNTAPLQVLINGQSFRYVSRVFLTDTATGNQTNLTQISNPDNSTIFATVPPNLTAKDYQLEVQTSGGPTNSVTLSVFDPVAIVTSVSPVVGPNSGPVTLQISGANLGTTSGITLTRETDAFEAGLTGVQVVSSTVVRGTVPAGLASEIYDVTVTNRNICNALSASPPFSPPCASVRTRALTYTATQSPTTTFTVPRSGANVSTTRIAVHGAGLLGTSAVSMVRRSGPGSASLTSVVVTTGTSVSATVPALLIPDTYDVIVTNPSGNSVTGNATFTVTENLPTIATIAPTSGLNTGITHVTVKGTNFEGVSTVSLSGGPTPRSFPPSSITSITQLLADIPAGMTPGAYAMKVTNTAGTSNSVTFTVQEPLPVVTGISPTSGVNATGVPVAVTGANFLGASAVTASGPGPTLLTLSVNVTNSALLGFSFPQENRPGAYTIKVINTAGTSASSQVFTVVEPLPSLSSLNPTSGTNVATDPVTIIGTGLWGTTQITLSGPQTISVAPLPPTTDRAVVCDVPPGLKPGPYSLTLTNSAGLSINALTYKVKEVVPNVLTITPTSGTDDVTQNVTITGRHFLGVNFVTISGPQSFITTSIVTANVTVTNDQVVTSQIPRFLYPGAYDVSVINTAGSTASFAIFTVTEKLPVINALDRPLGTPNASGNYNHPLVEFASGANMIGTTQGTLTPISGGPTVVVTGTKLVNPSFSSVGVTIPSSLQPGFYDYQLKNSDGLSNVLQYEVTEARPAVVSVKPAQGRYSTTHSVTLAGFNLLGAFDATLSPFDARPVLRTRQVTDEITPVSVLDASHVLFTVPTPIVPGLYRVTVVNTQGRSDISTAPTYLVTEPLPSISSLVPTSAPYFKPFVVTVNGSDLLGTLSVGFHNPRFSVDVPPKDVFSASRVDATTTLDIPGVYTVNVTNTAGVSNGLTFTVTEPLPVISQINPAATPYTTSATINVTGQNLLGVSEVDLAGTLENLTLKPPAQISRLSSTTMSFISTADTIPDTYTLTVVNTRGRSNAFTFKVTEPVSVLATMVPTSAVNTAATSVTLVGNDLLGVRRIDVIGPRTLRFTRPGQVSVVSSTRTTFTIPAQLPPGRYVVDSVNSSGISANTVIFRVLEALPVLTKVVPKAGKNDFFDNPVTVVITGQNMLGVNQVALTGPSTSITYSGPALSVPTFTTVTASMDLTGLPTATYSLRVVNSAGTSSNALPFEVTTIFAPTITSVSPPTATNTTGVSITVNGTQLQNTRSVTLTGPEVITLTNLVSDNVSGTFVVGRAPDSRIPGTYQVQALTANGDSNDNITFTFTEPNPTVTSINPSAGTNNTTVTTVIKGTNLRGVQTITLFPTTPTGKRGPARALLPDSIPVTTTSVTVTIPTSFYPDTYNVTVTDSQGQQAGGITYRVTETAPTVSSISPNTARDTVNVTATIRGMSLLGTQVVNLAGPTLATTVTTLPLVFFDRDQTRFQALIPSLLVPGSYVVSINNTAGLSTSPTTVTFKVTENLPAVASVTPSSGPITAPNPISVTGTDFLGAFNLALVGRAAGQPTVNVSVTGVTLTALSATVPANIVPGNYDVVVTNTAGPSPKVVLDTYTATEAPATLTSITPSAGPFSSTVNVSIAGTGLLGASAVKMTGPSSVTLTPSATAPTFVDAAVPINTIPGIYSVSVTTLAGTSTNTVSYNVTESAPGSAGPITILPTSGPRTFTTNVTITGNNLLGTLSATLNSTTTVPPVSQPLGNLTKVSASVLTGTVTTGLPLATYFIHISNTVGTFDGSLPTPKVTYTVVSPGPVTVTSINPNRGSNAGRTAVALAGSLLSETNLIELQDSLGNTFKLTGVTVKNDTLVNASVPPGIQPGSYEVLLERAFDTTLTDTGLTYLVEFPGPSIASLTTAIGPAGGGTSTTIVGSGFLTGAQILFGGVAATSASVTDGGHIQVVTPPFPVLSQTLPTPVVVSVINPDGQIASLSNGFTYNASTTPPEVLEFEPANGAGSRPQNTRITVRFSEPIKPSTVTFRRTVRIFQETAPLSGSFTELTTGTITVAADNRSVSFNPGVNLGNGLGVIAMVTSGITDVAGNALVNNPALGPPGETSIDPNEKQDELFTVGGSTDNTAPTVSSFSPNGGTGISTNVTPTATFSKSMNATTFDPTAFTLVSPPLVPVGGALTFSAGSSIITLTPPGNLRGSTTYQGVIRNTVADLAGNTLATTFTSIPFRTAPALTILTTKPANGDINVPTNQRLIIVFSAAVAPSTITSTTFRITPTAGATPIPLSATLSPDQKSAMLTPSTNLTPSTSFLWTDNGHITDTLGNPLDAPLSITFNTSTSADNSKPLVATITPANGATLVPITTNVTVTFSKAINPVSFSVSTLKLTNVAANVLVPSGFTVSTDLKSAYINPTALLATNTLFRIDATTGLQDTFGNALTTNVSSTFTTDSPKSAPKFLSVVPRVAPPDPIVRFLTLDRIPRELNGQGVAAGTLMVPPWGFTVDCDVVAPAGLWTILVDTDRPVGTQGRGRLWGPLSTTSSGYSIAVTSGMSFPAGHNRITVHAIDHLGRWSLPATFDFVVRDPARPGPLVQTFYVDVSRDLVGLQAAPGPSATVIASPNGRADFDDELYALGLEGPDPALNAFARDAVLKAVIAGAYAAFDLPPGGPDPTADTPQVRFIAGAPPLGFPDAWQVPSSTFPYSVIALGGTGPTTAPYVAPVDPGNGFQEDLRATPASALLTPPAQVLGVFPARVVLLGDAGTRGLISDAVWPFLPLSGSPLGAEHGDRDVMDGLPTPRTLAFDRAAQAYARVAGALLAHAAGHLMGLCAQGAPPQGLFGGASEFPGSIPWHLELPDALNDGALNLMSDRLDGVTLLTRPIHISPLDRAYLEGKLLYGPPAR